MSELILNESIRIGRDAPVFIIAEAGVNHNGDLQTAKRLVDEAARIGANAVKFQSFTAEELVTVSAPKAAYQYQTTSQQETQYEMLKRLELSPAEQWELADYCRSRNLLFLSTPYDEASVDLLEEIGVAAFKISSSDLTNIPLLRYVTGKQMPVILSTGMSTLGEVEDAVNIIRAGGNASLALLHCTSEYPAPLEESNLRAIETLKCCFACPVGFSDHTPGMGASPWAVARGACIIEKHFTLDQNLTGPDHAASLDPAGFSLLVQTIRQVEAALGDGVKRPMPSELRNKHLVQKGLYARMTIQAGDRISPAALACKRPARGLLPRDFDLVAGKIAARTIYANEPLFYDSIVWE